MQWRTLDIEARDVTLATGESLRTLASFQGHDGQTDIIKAHLAKDKDDLVLLTEFEGPAGNRLLGRTTQWPLGIIFEMFASDHSELTDVIAAHMVQETGADDEEDGIDTETNPQSSEPGGSGNSAAPAGDERPDPIETAEETIAQHPEAEGASLEQPEAPTESLEQPLPPETLEQPAPEQP